MKLKIPNRPFTGASYRPRSHIVMPGSEKGICGFSPKEGWNRTINKNTEYVECKNCLNTYIRYFDNLFKMVK